MDVDRLHDLLDIAAKKYPLKALAFDLNMRESTLRNQLTQQENFKLSLITFINIINKTNDLKALDYVESCFGRVAFCLPKPDKTNILPIMQMVATISKEFGDHMGAVAGAMEDGRFSVEEAAECHKELIDLITACVKLRAYFEQFDRDNVDAS